MQDVALPGTQGGQTPAHANIRAKLKSNSSGNGRTQLDAAAAALRSLFDTYGKPDVDEGWRNKQLKALGNTRAYPAKSPKEGDVDKVHKSLATKFNNDDGVHRSLAARVKDNDQAEKALLGGVCEIILQETANLQHLLARGSYQSTILHTILEPATYSQGSTPDTRGRLRFDRLKDLVKFLLWLQPELPTMTGAEGRVTPLFFVVKSGPIITHEEADSLDESSETGSNAEEQENPFLDETTKTEIVRFICDQNPEGKGGLTDPVRSLALLASQPETGASAARHAVHAAIESDFTLPDDIVARLKGITVDFKTDGSDKEEKKPCLEVPDRVGRTCLHLALTAPFTRNRIAWARQLAKVQPSLLKLRYKLVRTGESDTKDKPTVDYMTPLQYLVEERKRVGMNGHKDKIKVGSPKEVELLNKELDDLKEFLKCQCLESFDHITCKAIMYTRQTEREVFLTLSDETISSEFLANQKGHYKLDTSLQSVHIANNNRIQWDDNKLWDDSTHKVARSWQCLGNTDLFMVFHWLKDIVKVKKVFEVVVDELAKSPGGHSDVAIVECLKNLGVETWNWRRMDIPVNVIIDAAGDHVKSLYLYCSGLRAVLQSWSDTRGLVNLKHLERVEVEVHQGLESKESVKKFAENFKDDMEKIHAERYKSDIEKGLKSKLEVVCNPVYAASKRNPANNDTASKVKADGDSGFEEQDWLKCMDEFAELMENIEMNPQSAKGRPIKVALIDDGVKTSYAWLDENVDCGKSGWGSASATPKGGDKKKAAKNYPRNYNYSQTGHGTVMAYFIRRVCPWVKLCIAKLDCQTRSRSSTGSGNNQPVTFSIESATEAIIWAVNEKVDIISMSWAIDKSDSKQVGQLREAITLAADRGILLFCANPDKNMPGTLEYKDNDTYPKALVPEKTLFCIGAATQEGKRWRQISEHDQSCDFFLPGVELDIPEENTTIRKSQGEPPHGWRKHSGSSLSCALAAGLAAMVLHCTLVSGLPSDDPKWKWLRSRDGMRKALQNISAERDDRKGLWLPVRRVFGEAAKTLDGPQKQMLDALHTSVVDELLKGAPRPSANGPAKDAEPAPGRLKKRVTIKDGEY